MADRVKDGEEEGGGEERLTKSVGDFTTKTEKEEVGTTTKPGSLVNEPVSSSGPKNEAISSSDAGGDPCRKSKDVETIDFKVIYNKTKYEVNRPLDSDIAQLKSYLQPLIHIPPAMMKVMIKGLAKDSMTLRSLGVTKGSKVMVVGSSLNDVLQVSTTPKEVIAKETSGGGENKSSLWKQHKRVLDKGKPDDAMPGLRSNQEPLPTFPLSGMLNKHGGKVRLTFKLEQDQVWIGTKERTEKVPLNSIKKVVSEPMEGHPEYHIVALQLGPTEASRYWIYWVPAQYVNAMKDTIMGKWQYY